MPRLTRMSKIQKMFLVTYLENNKFLLQSNKLKPSELEKFANGWKTFASELNKLEGAQKNVIQWKDTLNEFKVNTRKKARLLHEETVGTGGGPKTLKPLSELEERLLALLSKIVIIGAPDIPEGGIIEDMPNRDVNPEIVIEEYLVNELPGPSSDNKEDSTVTMAVREANPKPLPKSKKRVGDYKTSELSSIATEHEKCLRILADSNNNLANAIRKRRKIKSAVLNLQF